LLPPAARTDLRSRFLTAALCAVLAACQTSAPPPGLAPANFADLPGWSADDQGQALIAFKRSCGALAKLSPNQVLAEGRAGTARIWQAACNDARAVETSAARSFFERRFRPWRVYGESGDQGLFTGYYLAEVRGSFRRQGKYLYPIYGRPKDLIGDQPYRTRAEIDAGALTGQNLEIMWLDDPVDAFFLHIQGSGRAVMDDGRVVLVGFAAHNNRPYTAVGRLLVDRGELASNAVSMQSIRSWMAARPDRGKALMAENARYVFFRQLTGDAPVGAQGVPLVPGRSLAVDPHFTPYGTPVWLDATDPKDRTKPLRRLLVAQDTGAAIRGQIRGDLFWGWGPEAAERAGLMQERGRWFLLLPREVDPIPRA
jgi:membrane-bound lytic murein transglycosylase A